MERGKNRMSIKVLSDYGQQKLPSNIIIIVHKAFPSVMYFVKQQDIINSLRL